MHQNLHRHQKNKKKQTTRCTKPSHLHRHQNKKKLKNPGTMVHFWIVAGICVFFCFFWCLSMFGASNFVFFFWCLSMFCEVRVTEAEEQKISQVVRRRYSAEFCGWVCLLLNVVSLGGVWHFSASEGWHTVVVFLPLSTRRNIRSLKI